MHFTPDEAKTPWNSLFSGVTPAGGRAAVNLRLGDLPDGARTKDSWSAVEEHFWGGQEPTRSR